VTTSARFTAGCMLVLAGIDAFAQATARRERLRHALSGLSMGGIQTLNIGLHNLGTFRYRDTGRSRITICRAKR